MLFPRVFSTAICILLLALAGCGEREFEPVVAAEEDVEPLPAPLPAAGAVTTPPGAIAADGAVATTEPADPVALAVITPVPGQEEATATPVEGSTVVHVSADGSVATDGSGAAIAFADGALPPLEDNPEAGLSAAPVHLPASGPVAVAAPSGEREAVAAVRAYYDALRTGDVARAYSAWSDGGRASGRTPEQFAAGVEGLAIASVSTGEPGRVEGAAGSRYVEVPVTVTSRARDGREVRQVGSFVMRSSQVEGAPRGWHIASAELRELQP
jgi:hypothetical protein